MKTFIHRSFSILILFVLILSLDSTTGNVRALTQLAANPVTLTFAELGATDLVMQGPYDSQEIRFSLPVNWVLQEGSSITLFIDTSATGSAGKDLTGSDPLGGTLDVYFNGNLQKSVQLRVGQSVEYNIPIEPKSLKPENRDGRMGITFFLNAVTDCEFDLQHTTINIRSESNLLLSYAESAVSTDLRLLPWPIYQSDINFPNPALLIMPDNAYRFCW